MQKPDIHTQLAVEQFLFREADLLDRWQLDEWLSLYSEDARYEVAPTGEAHPETLSPETSLFIIADNRYRLEQRVLRLQKPSAWVESPHSRTRHLYGNVRIVAESGDELSVQANLIVWRTSRNVTTQYPGHAVYTLLKDKSSGYRIRHKRVILDLDALVPQGRVGLLL